MEHLELCPGYWVTRCINRREKALLAHGIKTELHSVPGDSFIPVNYEADCQGIIAFKAYGIMTIEQLYTLALNEPDGSLQKHQQPSHSGRLSYAVNNSATHWWVKQAVTVLSKWQAQSDSQQDSKNESAGMSLPDCTLHGADNEKTSSYGSSREQWHKHQRISAITSASGNTSSRGSYRWRGRQQAVKRAGANRHRYQSCVPWQYVIRRWWTPCWP